MARFPRHWIPFILGFALSAPFAFGAGGDNRPDAAIPILQAFQASCDSVGSWTEGATAQTTSIAGIIQQLRSTDACKPYVAQLEEIQPLATEIERNLSTSGFRAVKLQEDTLRQLALELKSAKDPTLIADLNADIATAEQSLAEARAQASFENSDHNWNQTVALAGYLNQLTLPNSSPTLGDCLHQSPAASIELASNLLAYAGSFISPIYGAASSIVGTLVNVGLEVFRQHKYDKATWDIELDQMPLALRCALETMTEYYCKAEDSSQLVELSAANARGLGSTPLYRGLDLATRYMPSLITWLGEVESGVLSADSYQSARKNAIRAKREQVVEMKDTVTGEINDAIAAYNNASAADPSVKDPPMRALISAIATPLIAPIQVVSTVNGSTTINATPSAFSSFQPNQYYWACFLVTGLSDQNACKTPPSQTDLAAGGDPVVTYLTKNYLQSDTEIQSLVPALLNNWKTLVGLVEQQVDLDFSRIIQANAEDLITTANEEGLNGANTPSPVESMDAALEFLGLMRRYPGVRDNPNLNATIQHKIEQIKQAIAAVNQSDGDVCEANSKVDCPHQRLTKISDIFDLKDGTGVFSASMNHLVEIDLVHRLQNGEFPKKKADILRYLGMELQSILTESGLTDKNPLSADLNNAKDTTQANLRNFRTFFAKGFVDVVKREADQAAGEDASGPNRPHGEILGALCTQWLITARLPLSPGEVYSDWPDADVARICNAATIYSANRGPNPDGTYSPAISVGTLAYDLRDQPFGRRVCAYHEYRRQDFLSTLPTTGRMRNR